MPLNFDLGGKTYDPVTRTISPEEIEAYADASGDANPRHRKGEGQIAPVIFPVVPGFPLLGAATTDPELGVDNPLMILHGEEEIVQHRPMRAGETLVFSPSLRSVEDKGRNGVYVVACSAATEDGEAVSEQYATIVVRGAGSGGDRPSSPKPQPVERGEPAASFTQHVPVDMPPRYAEASGDHNPIHLDDAVAKAVGLPGVINHGLGTLSLVTGGLVGHLAGSDPARVRRVRVRFTDVVFPGGELTTSVWGTDGSYEFETTRSDGAAVMAGAFEVAPA